MSIRYVNALPGEPGMPLYALRITDAADYATLPTPTRAGLVFDENFVQTETFAAIGSTVASDDLSIIGELQSDGAWHQIGGGA